LRHYVNNTYSNWILLLFMTQLALNAKVSNITKITLFFVNYNKKLNLFKEEQKHLLAQLVIERIATLKMIHDNILKMQEKLIKY